MPLYELDSAPLVTRHSAMASARDRRIYRRPVVITWGALEALTRGGPASGSDASMTGSTTFGFLFFGTDEWHLFNQGNNR